ncbi:MAG: putative unusual protein kinase [halophilic archaeon J07HX5]|nr:MAG: putative unusual protein kinase [halophilic archaeon J07HX5]
MTLRAYRRLLTVLRQFLPFVIAYTRDRRRFLLFGGPREPTSEKRRHRANRLIESLIELGPTFIKIGQLLSTRPDVLPPEYVAEFARLQDDVPPADWPAVERVITTNLGPVEDVFDSFDTTAISGASLGQVYRAEVDGQPVAVKVRRPGVKQLVEADLRVIRWLLPVLMRFAKDAQSFSLESLADEFEMTIRQEMDYGREAQMLRRVRSNFSETDEIRMPAVIGDYSTDRVLIMEYVEATKITDLDGLDRHGLNRSALAKRLQRAYMQMLIEDGVFHADPHPGNLAVTPDGTLVFYDFGMSGYVDEQVQAGIVDAYTAAFREDTEAILDTMVELGVLSAAADRQLMTEVAELALKDARGQDVDQYRVQQLVREFEGTIYEFPFRLPPNLALVLRVATVVEGVCVTLDPNFDFIDVATTYFRQQGYAEAGAREYASTRVEAARTAAGATLRLPTKLEQALETINRDQVTVTAELDADRALDRLARRLVYGLLLAAGIVASSVLAGFAPTAVTAVAVGLTLVVAVVLYRSFRDQEPITGDPQFTRQRLRSGEGRGLPGQSRGRSGSTTGQPVNMPAGTGLGETDSGGDDDSDTNARDGTRTKPGPDDDGDTNGRGGSQTTINIDVDTDADADADADNEL